MMRAKALFCMSLLIPMGVAHAQEVDTTFQKRNLRQQLFVIDYMKEHEAVELFSAPDEIDAYLDALSASWAKEVADEDPHLAQFNPYVYIWALHMLMGTDAPDWANCHVYVEYMVPAFLADFDRYSADVTPENAFLVRWGLDWMISSMAFECEVPPQHWVRLRSAFDRIPPLMERYLETRSYADDNVKRQLQEAKRSVGRMGPLIDLRGALYRADLDATFAGLAAAFIQGYPSEYLIALGKQLWQSYKAAGEAHKALATLDLLTRSLTSGDVPRDSLMTWYEAVDPELGLKRYNQVAARSGLPALVPSDRQADLTGRYIDLASDAYFDLSELEGQVALFDFWATWCSPCIAEIPKLNELVTEYGDDFILVSVSSDALTGGADEEGVQDFMAKHGTNYMVLYDDPAHSLTERFGVAGWPTKFLVNEKGEFMRHPTDESRGAAIVKLEEVEAYLADERD